MHRYKILNFNNSTQFKVYINIKMQIKMFVIGSYRDEQHVCNSTCVTKLHQHVSIYVSYVADRSVLSVISGFRSDIDVICALLGYYATSSGNPVPRFWNSVSVPSSMAVFILEDGTDRLSRNVGKGLPFDV
jgi:hypothetical protein